MFSERTCDFYSKIPTLEDSSTNKIQFCTTGLNQPPWYPPVHFLRLESYLTPGRVSLHLKSSSQNSANQMFLLLFSRDLEMKYWSKPETMKVIERELCRSGPESRAILHSCICTLLFSHDMKAVKD